MNLVNRISKARNARFNQMRKHILFAEATVSKVFRAAPTGTAPSESVTDADVADLRDALSDALAAFHEFNAHRNDVSNLGKET